MSHETLTTSEFKLNGYKIGTSTVDAHLRADIQAQTQHRSSSHRPTSEAEERRWTGKNLPRIRCRLVLEGPTQDVADEVRFLADIVDVEDRKDHVTLEAAGPFWRDVDRAAVWPDGFVEKPRSNDKDTVYQFNLNLLIRGEWVCDGGEYEHKEIRWFRRLADGRWERWDTVIFSEAEGPLIRLPDQHHTTLDDTIADGYPIFVRRDTLEKEGRDEWDWDGAKEKDSDASSRGFTRHEALYDVTDYIHPLPTSGGDIGRVPLWQCPSSEWFEGHPAIDSLLAQAMDQFKTQDANDVQPIAEFRETEKRTIVDRFADADTSEYTVVHPETGTEGTFTSIADKDLAIRGNNLLRGKTGTDGDAALLLSTAGLGTYPSRGDSFEVFIRTTDGVNQQDTGFLFAVANEGTPVEGYRVRFIQAATEVRLQRIDGWSSKVDLDSEPYTVPQKTWHRIEVDWNADDRINVRFYEWASGDLVASLTAVDGTYSANTGIGFSTNDPGDDATSFFDGVSIFDAEDTRVTEGSDEREVETTVPFRVDDD